MNCANDQKRIEKTAVASGGLLFCSTNCRDAFAAANAGKDVKRSRDADGGVIDDRKPRILSQSEIRRKLSTTSERSVSKSAADYLDRRGVYHTRLQSGARPVQNKAGQTHYMKLCRIGTPDRMFADGLICFLEIKSPGKDRSPEQIEVAEQLKANGALVFTIDGFDQAEFVVSEMIKRSARIEAIAVAIQEIQNEIDSAFTERK